MIMDITINDEQVIQDWVQDHIPCQSHCPFQIDISKALEYIDEGFFDKALDLFLLENPFPRIAGSLCLAPCEFVCKRKKIDHPVSIQAVERLLSETNDAAIIPFEIPKPHKKTKRIAIIGAGPAGLSLTYFLRKRGFSVTLIDQNEKPGGRLLEIPDFVIPKVKVEAEINRILGMDIEVKMNIKILPGDLTDAWADAYDGVAIAVSPTMKFAPPFADSPNERVLDGFKFLNDASSGKALSIGEEVVVIGGNQMAAWCARYAKRMGVKNVRIYVKESKLLITLSNEEVRLLASEGISVHYLYTPSRIIASGNRIKGIKLLKNKLLPANAQGIQFSEPQSNQEVTIDCDTVICADLLSYVHPKSDYLGSKDSLYHKFKPIKNNPFETEHPTIFVYHELKDDDHDFPNFIRPISEAKQWAWHLERMLNKNQTATLESARTTVPLYTNTTKRFTIQPIPETQRTKPDPIIPVDTNYPYAVNDNVTSDRLSLLPRLSSQCIRCSYRIRLTEENLKHCIHCGICGDVCPTQVIEFTEDRQLDESFKLGNHFGITLTQSLTPVMVNLRKENPVRLKPFIAREKDCIRCLRCVVDCPLSIFEIEKLDPC